MSMKKYIDLAVLKAGNQKILSDLLGVSSQQITNAKAGRSGLPNFACVEIAQMIGVEAMTVIAASELVTEKNEERRRIWHPFVNHAATVIMGITGIVILNMTPAPAQANEINVSQPDHVYYVKSRKRIGKIIATIIGWLYAPHPKTAAQQIRCAG